MSDTTYETQCKGLSGDDAMAYGFFERAATAIVERSQFAKDLVGLREDVRYLTEARDVLDDIKRTQQDRIALLEEQLRGALDAEARARSDLAEVSAERDRRTNDVRILDGHLDNARSRISALEGERDEYALAHTDAQNALDIANGKLGQLGEVFERLGLGKPAMLAESVAKPEPKQVTESPAYPMAGQDVAGDVGSRGGEPDLPSDEELDRLTRPEGEQEYPGAVTDPWQTSGPWDDRPANEEPPPHPEPMTAR